MSVAVTVEQPDLVVTVTGWDAVWALSKGFRVPLAQVREARVLRRKEALRRIGLRLGGTALPGVVVAGRYWRPGRWQFWAARWPERVLVVDCAPEAKYARVALGVTDPEADAARVEAALLS